MKRKEKKMNPSTVVSPLLSLCFVSSACAPIRLLFSPCTSPPPPPSPATLTVLIDLRGERLGSLFNRLRGIKT